MVAAEPAIYSRRPRNRQGAGVNINLIGMRGVGKSNVARRLSVMAKMPVMSTDALVEYETGRTVVEFVADHGGDWRPFRDLEYHVLGKLAAMDGLIIDCGGGIVVDLGPDGEEIYSERKVRRMRAIGPVVWLQGDIEQDSAAKSEADPARPSLHASRTAIEIMERRRPWYEQAADHGVFVHQGMRQAVAGNSRSGSGSLSQPTDNERCG